MSRNGMAGMIRLSKWHLDDKRRSLADLEKMKEGFLQNLTDLQDELTREQKNVAESSVVDISYAAYAQQVMVRRLNIVNSMGEIDVSLEDMKDQVADAFKELKKYEVVEQRQMEREKADRARRQQGDMDELALNMHRRRQNQG